MIEALHRPYLETLSQPKPWWLLEGTGFNVASQIEKFRTNAKDGKPISFSIKQTIQDIMGYNLEYLADGLVFPIKLGIKNGRVVGTEYGDQPLLDTILPEERNGAVRDSVARIEKFLVNGKSGGVAIMVSPPGPSGLTSAEGKQIIFPDTQIYFFKKGEGNQLKAMTLRLDLSLTECEQLLSALDTNSHPRPEDRRSQGSERSEGSYRGSINNADLMDSRLRGNDREGAEQVVRRVIFKHSEQGEFLVDDLIDRLEDLKGGGKAYKDRSFNEMRKAPQKLNELWQMDRQTREIVLGFVNFAFSLGDLTEEKYKALEKVLGETLLKLTLFVRRGMVPRNYAQFGDLMPLEYMGALDLMRSLGGCAGGGLTSVGSMFGFRVGYAMNGRIKKNWSYSEKFCIDCQRHKLEVGPCNICIDCEAKYG